MTGLMSAANGLVYITRGTLGSANAKIQATGLSGYRYLRVILYGRTTADITATVIPRLTFNDVVTGYFARSQWSSATAFTSSTEQTTYIPTVTDNTGARVIECVFEVISPSSDVKFFTGTGSINASGANYVFVAGAQNTSTADITTVEFTVTGTTWTTDTELFVFGVK